MGLNKIDAKKLKLLIVVPVLLLAAVVYSFVKGGDADIVELDGSGVSSAASADAAETVNRDGNSGSVSESGDKAAVSHIYVDVSGAVRCPDVVKIPAGSRVFEAVDAAGGRNEDADTRSINLAAVCEDGQKIYIPARGEEEEGIICDVSGAEKSKSADNGKVNINSADSQQLQTLSGIGPSMASRIIEYREANGRFAAVEDLKKVSGIGEKTFAKFADKICV